MAITLTCRHCDITISAATEAELVDLARAHAREHGHATVSREKILARIHRHNPKQA